MNSNHINNSDATSNANSQHWMMGTDHRSEYTNYMLSRPPGPVLPQQQPTRQRQPSFKQDEQASTSSNEYEAPASTSSKSKSNRSVIPSKRAAQNRAAQKAFRQRREQYIKDLEIKAKEMDEWQAEMEKLKKENTELRDRVISLEHQIQVLTGGDATKLANVDKLEAPVAMMKRMPERSMSLPITKNTETVETAKRPSLHESRLRQEVDDVSGDEELPKEGTGPFAPVPLRAPHQAGFEQNYIAEDTKRRKLEEAIGPAPIHHSFTKVNMIQPSQPLQYPPFWDNNTHEEMSELMNANTQQQPPPPPPPPPPQGMTEFDLDFDFDPFFEEEFGPTLTNNNDFLPNANSNQVLDDLFAMLQTRQRPQIPMVPSDDTSTTDTIGRIG